nr:ribonuclease H-like domain-containing protein [Tanacetum cinerariifolium]
MKKHNQLVKLMQFLMGLDESYLAIRSNIFTIKPLLLVKAAFAIVSGDESYSNATTVEATKPTAIAFAVKTFNNKKRPVSTNNAFANVQSNNISTNNATRNNSHVFLSNEQLTRLKSLLNDKGVSTANANMHQRLGHPADQVLDVLKTALNLDSNSVFDHLCDSSNKAKQTRELFPLSKSNVVADALSRKERDVPLRVRALVMNVSLDLPKQILAAPIEALKPENLKKEDVGVVMSADSVVTYSSVHSKPRSWSIPSKDPYEEAAQQLFEQDLVPAKDEAPVSLLPPGFLSPRIRPLSPRALRAEMNAIASSLYHSLHPSGTPPLLSIPLSTPSTSHRAGILEADTPPRNRPLLATPRPGCEVEKSSVATVRRPGPTMAHRVDCSYVETRL